MSKRFFVGALLVSTLVLAVFVALNGNKSGDSAFAQSPGASVTRWEYKLVMFDGNMETGLNQLGLEGWELVAVTVSGGHRYYLKRPKR